MKDELLIKLVIKSNSIEEIENVFNDIYNKYKPLVVFIVSKYISNQDDIEDVVQDTFIELFNDVENIKTSIKSYLTISSKHNALDFIKKNKKITYVEDNTLDHLFNGDLDNCSHIEFKYLINDMGRYLSKEDIGIILLHLLDDMTFKEIGNKLNQNEKTIKTKYYRGLKKYQKIKGGK